MGRSLATAAKALPKSPISYRREYEIADAARFWGCTPDSFRALPVGEQAEMIAFMRTGRLIAAVEQHTENQKAERKMRKKR